MNSFTILLLILLILSIANNFIMYHKCYISRNITSVDPKLDPNIGFYPVNIYYLKNNNVSAMQCPSSESSGSIIIDDIKNNLEQYVNKNKTKCVITYGEPTSYEYQKIKSLV